MARVSSRLRGLMERAFRNFSRTVTAVPPIHDHRRSLVGRITACERLEPRHMLAATSFDGNDTVEIAHTDSMEVANGTVAVSFTSDNVLGRHAIFSKDAKGYGAGGHILAQVRDSRLEVQLQSTSQTFTLKTEAGTIRPGDAHHLAITFGADGFRLYLDGALAAWRPDVTTGLNTNEESLVLGAATSLRDVRNRNVRTDYFVGVIDDFQIYDRALNRAEIALLGTPTTSIETAGTTGTGLDQLVDVILQDNGLYRSIPRTEVEAGAGYANQLNAIIVQALYETGVANDRTITASDLRDVNAYIRANHLDEWTALHGDDADTGDTGFHQVQNDGATSQMFGDENAVNTVADGIYHLGFEISWGRLLNEDGNQNASLKDVAFWLSKLLGSDLAKPQNPFLNSNVNLDVEGTTNTGLDRIIEIIMVDPGLNRNLATSQIAEGATSADAMNRIIIESIVATGVANDHAISPADVRDVSAYIRGKHADAWKTLHGDDEDGEETGFHLVQDDGASTHIFGDDNAVNTVADGVYHLGFAVAGDRLLNEDGNANASLRDVAFWLNEFLAVDLAGDTLANPNVSLTVTESTGTGLDELVSIILADPGLNRNIPTSELVEGARSAAAMNALIVGAIRSTGVANDKTIGVTDIRDLNAVLVANHSGTWIELHGDDEDGEETGFHLVQDDGANTYLFGDENAVNTVADGIYHLGFSIRSNRLLNEDGNANASLKDVAFWLNELLARQLADGSLANPALAPDLAAIESLSVLGPRSATVDKAGDQLEIAHTSTLALGSGTIALSFTADDVVGRKTLFSKDAKGFGDGGHITAFIRDGRVEVQLQTVTETITLRSEVGSVRAGESHHVAVSFGTKGFQLYLDGDIVASRDDITIGLDKNVMNLVIGGNTSLREKRSPSVVTDFFDGTIQNFTVYGRSLNRFEVAAIAPAFVPPGMGRGTSGTGLDRLIDIIYTDRGLLRNVPLAEIAQAADSANQMNVLIVAAIRATGAANDGSISAADVRDINSHLHNNSADTWVLLHGDDEDGIETGFHLAQNDGATTQIFGDDNAVNTVADGIYHLGFAICGDRLLNEDGNANASIEDVAFWLNEFLAADLTAGSLANNQVSVTVTGTTSTGLDGIVNLVFDDRGLKHNVATSELVEAATSANRMNEIIVAAIRATGVANDGQINTADIREVNAWIVANHGSEWAELHGDDECQEETGFHLVQNDGAKTRLFGDDNAVDTVADGIYHLGFAICGDHLLNEDGNANASLEDVAFWLSEFLQVELANGSLANSQVDLAAVPSSDSGLDQLIRTINADPGLNRNLKTSDIVKGADFANEMNIIIVKAIRETGVANDGKIDVLDVRDIQRYIRDNYQEAWARLHGDDENGEETGFHLVQDDGARTQFFGDDNAVDTVADGIYHLGFEICYDRLVNEDGNANASLKDVAFWLSELLANNLAGNSLQNSALKPDPQVIASDLVFSLDG